MGSTWRSLSTLSEDWRAWSRFWITGSSSPLTEAPTVFGSYSPLACPAQPHRDTGMERSGTYSVRIAGSWNVDWRRITGGSPGFPSLQHDVLRDMLLWGTGGIRKLSNRCCSRFDRRIKLRLATRDLQAGQVGTAGPRSLASRSYHQELWRLRVASPRVNGDWPQTLPWSLANYTGSHSSSALSTGHLGLTFGAQRYSDIETPGFTDTDTFGYGGRLSLTLDSGAHVSSRCRLAGDHTEAPRRVFA